MSKTDVVKVGLGCVVFKDGKILLGKRVTESHGGGEYTCGGGHLEYGENLAEAVQREIEEEWGIKVSQPQFLCVTNLRKYSGKHYIDIGFRADWISGEPNPQSAGEFAGFDWYSSGQPPTPLFGVVPNYLEAIASGTAYFETAH